MAKQNKPAIRFKEFTDAWEQRKLGEVVERITRKNENLESTLPLTISAQYGLINQNEFFDKRIASKDVSGYFLVRNGEFAYNKSTSSDAPWGAIKRLDRYESGVLSTLYIVFKISDERKTSSDYIVTYYNTDLWHKGIQAIAAEGARNHGLLNVAPADFFETSLTMPKDYAEQQKIGSFFQQLDNLITLHQRKYDKLQVLKKAMLEKMFPKNSSGVPEIRFKGFTDAWEQRKAKDLCSISTGKSNTQDRVDDGIYPFYVRSPIVEHSNRYLFDEEAVLTGGDGVGTGKVFHYVNGKYDLHQRVYRMFDFSEEITAKYFYYYFSNHFYDRVMAMTAKTSVDSVRYEMIADMDIALPKVKEQMAISAYFDRLDHLITLHQRELEKLQNIKKSMLEKMFV